MPVRFSRHLPFDQINAAIGFINQRSSSSKGKPPLSMAPSHLQDWRNP